MARKAVEIRLCPRLTSLMEKELSKRQIKKDVYERIYIVYKSSRGELNQTIACELGCGVRKVGLWRKYWYDRTKDLDITVDESGEILSDKKITERIFDLLSDAPRSGCPARITQAETIRLMALACEDPQTYNLPFTVWTHQELSNQAKRLDISISRSHYGNLLKKTTCSRTNQVIGFSPKLKKKKNL